MTKTITYNDETVDVFNREEAAKTIGCEPKSIGHIGNSEMWKSLGVHENERVWAAAPYVEYGKQQAKKAREAIKRNEAEQAKQEQEPESVTA